MAKKEQVVKSGKRITGRKASADTFTPLYEFLLFDPTYREMKAKAKILYSFLRKKTLYFEKITEEPLFLRPFSDLRHLDPYMEEISINQLLQYR